MTAHALFPSTRIALTRQSTSVSFGKMPVTLLPPLIAAMASHPRCRWPKAQSSSPSLCGCRDGVIRGELPVFFEELAAKVLQATERPWVIVIPRQPRL